MSNRELEIFRENFNRLLTYKADINAVLKPPDPKPTPSTTSGSEEQENKSTIIRNLLLYEGVADSGTTRLLSEIATIAEVAQGVVVTDFTLTSNDVNR